MCNRTIVLKCFYCHSAIYMQIIRKLLVFPLCLCTVFDFCIHFSFSVIHPFTMFSPALLSMNLVICVNSSISYLCNFFHFSLLCLSIFYGRCPVFHFPHLASCVHYLWATVSGPSLLWTSWSCLLWETLWHGEINRKWLIQTAAHPYLPAQTHLVFGLHWYKFICKLDAIWPQTLNLIFNATNALPIRIKKQSHSMSSSLTLLGNLVSVVHLSCNLNWCVFNFFNLLLSSNQQLD